MSEHARTVNAVVTGIAARPFAAARAMSRFLDNDRVGFTALIEPAGDAVRDLLSGQDGRQRRHKVESSAHALLAGLEHLLALDDPTRSENLAEVLALAHRVPPRLFPQRPG